MRATGRLAAATRRIPWVALLVTGALVPGLFVWCFVGGIPLSFLTEFVPTMYIVDYKRAPDGTELLLTNPLTSTVPLSVRRPGGPWVSCWLAFDDPPFDGEIEVYPNETKAFVRRERVADFVHFKPKEYGRLFDWSLPDDQLCGTQTIVGQAGAGIGGNPVLGEYGTELKERN
jgi:hypothetical protein